MNGKKFDWERQLRGLPPLPATRAQRNAERVGVAIGVVIVVGGVGTMAALFLSVLLGW